MNKIILLGRLGKDPETAYTKSSKAYTKFTLAVDCGYGENKRTEWFNVKCWEKLAETVQKFCAKGKQVLIEGELQQSQYTDKNGVEKTWVEVSARNVQFLGSKADGDSQAQGANIDSFSSVPSPNGAAEVPF